MPMGFPADGLASGLRYQAQAGDIFVCSYPKCGTTWAQYIVYLLMHDGTPLPAGRTLVDVFPHLEEVGCDVVGHRPKPRLIKTHLCRSMVPFNAQAKYVYIARNPFDCAVSFYHHTRGFVKHYEFGEGTFDEFFECFIRGEVDFGDYFDNLMSWCGSEPSSNLLFLTYEQMKSDARLALEQIGNFLGGAAMRAVDDPVMADRILTESGFASMREDQHRWSSERPAEMPEFIRRGIVGDWEQYFSAQQAKRLLARLELRTRDSAAAELWPHVTKAARLFSDKSLANGEE